MRELWVLEGPNRGAMYRLGPGTIRLGRSADLEVYLPDARVSRTHAVIEPDPEADVEPGSAVESDAAREGALRVRDLGSKNRTALNGVPLVDAARLEPGDELRLGGTVLLLVEAGNSPGAALKHTSTQTLVGAGDAASAHVAAPPTVAPAVRAPSSPRPAVAPRYRAPAARDLVGSNPVLLEVLRLVARVAPLQTTVLLRGETGTGKELVAEALHRLGRRRGPFVPVSCATLEPQLLESELFGHERGAFTGAVARRLGKLELARGGTLFLDEVAELPLEAQAKLLRALETRTFERLGGGGPQRTDARFVAATHQDLGALVRAGRFRKDLWYRLKVVELELPPLRERPQDLEPLLEHLVGSLRREIPTRVQSFSPEAIAALRRYPFPGNVRELKNLVERVLIFADEAVVSLGDLPLEIRGAVADPGAAPGAGSGAGSGAGAADLPGEILSLEEVERRHLARALRATGGNKAQAARLLGIDRKTLHQKARRLGVET